MSFVIIPEIVDRNKNLHPNSKRLCGYIISLSGARLGCIASNNYFADRLGVSIRTVSRYLEELKLAEYIEVDFIDKPHSNQGQQRIITPTGNIIVDMKTAKKNEYKREEFKPEWLDSVMSEL